MRERPPEKLKLTQKEKTNQEAGTNPAAET
jgi:hypothetical protein